MGLNPLAFALRRRLGFFFMSSFGRPLVVFWLSFCTLRCFLWRPFLGTTFFTLVTTKVGALLFSLSPGVRFSSSADPVRSFPSAFYPSYYIRRMLGAHGNLLRHFPNALGSHGCIPGEFSLTACRATACFAPRHAFPSITLVSVPARFSIELWRRPCVEQRLCCG